MCPTARSQARWTFETLAELEQISSTSLHLDPRREDDGRCLMLFA